MSDEHEIAGLATPIVLIAKLHRTVSDGNYGNDRYEVPVPIEWTPGQPIEPLWEQAFAAARAQIDKEAAYDDRIRDLKNKYRYSRGQSVADWDALIAQFSADTTLQAHHRESFLHAFGVFRTERIEQDEKERMEKTRLAAVALAVISSTMEYVDANPIPEPTDLWAGVPLYHGATPPYYEALHKTWLNSVPSYTDLPSHVRSALQRSTIGGIIGAELEELMAGKLPVRERPAEVAPPAPPPFEEEWDEDDEDPRHEDEDE
jgi:hypothetical protein